MGTGHPHTELDEWWLPDADPTELDDRWVNAATQAPGAAGSAQPGASARRVGVQSAFAMEGVRALLSRVQPIPRCGEPGDVAQTAVFLASDESTFVTGQAVVVDGGLLAGADGRAMAEVLRGGVGGSG